MKLFAVFTALLLPFLIAAAVQAQQPGADSIDVDTFGCSYSVEFIDGTDVSTKVEVFALVNGVPSVIPVKTQALVDVVGDQSAVVITGSGLDGDEYLARLTITEEKPYEVEFTLECTPPTPTATATPTSTATPTNTATPAPTSTPAPAATSTPVPPVPTPIVITNTVVQERVVTVEVPVTRTVISPPSTGSAGLR